MAPGDGIGSQARDPGPGVGAVDAGLEQPSWNVEQHPLYVDQLAEIGTTVGVGVERGAEALVGLRHQGVFVEFRAAFGVVELVQGLCERSVEFVAHTADPRFARGSTALGFADAGADLAAPQWQVDGDGRQRGVVAVAVEVGHVAFVDEGVDEADREIGSAAIAGDLGAALLAFDLELQGAEAWMVPLKSEIERVAGRERRPGAQRWGDVDVGAARPIEQSVQPGDDGGALVLEPS